MLVRSELTLTAPAELVRCIAGGRNNCVAAAAAEEGAGGAEGPKSIEAVEGCRRIRGVGLLAVAALAM
jgi:hypothetical protein